MNYRYIMLLGLAAAFSTSAQEKLSKEIDVEREIVPELRAASRMNIFPATMRPDLRPVTLTPGQLTEAADYQPLTPRYEPAWAGFAADPTRYRGYVDLGYFPASDFGFDAGVAAVANASTTLKFWTSLSRCQWADKLSMTENPEDYKVLDFIIGGDLAAKFTGGVLKVNTTFNYSNFNKWDLAPAFDAAELTRHLEFPNQKVTGFNLGAEWLGATANRLRYNLGLGGGIFNFSKAGGYGIDYLGYNELMFMELSPVHQTDINVKLGASLPVGEYSRAGVDLTSDWLHFNSFASDPIEYDRTLYGGDSTPAPLDINDKTQSVTSLTPFFGYNDQTVSARIGAKIDLTTGGGKKFHIAPDVLLGVNPVAYFGATLRFGGGEHLNTMQSLYAVSRYISPLLAYSPSHIPLTGELALRVGPFRGIALEAGGAYANAHDWLMWNLNETLFNSFRAVNLHAFKMFVKLSASWRDYVTFEARYDRRFGNDNDNLWYTWRDGARSVLTASLTLKPIKPLTVNVDYTLRQGRTMDDGYTSLSLGNYASLSAGATYRINEPLSVFARFDNILNRRNCMIFGYESRGFNGLFGASYKF